MWPSYLDTARANCILNTGYAWCILYASWIQYSHDILFSIYTVDITFILSVSRTLSVSHLYPGYYLYPIYIQDVPCILSVSGKIISLLSVSRILSVSYLYPICIQDIICILSVSRILPVPYLHRIPGYQLQSWLTPLSWIY